MKIISYLSRDDATGKFSGTTLRTWILFIVFVLFAAAFGVIAVLMAMGRISSDMKPGVLSFFEYLGTFCLLGQAAYLGKRIAEKIPYKNNYTGEEQCTTESIKTKKL